MGVVQISSSSECTSICSASILRDQNSASSPVTSEKPDGFRDLPPLGGGGRVGTSQRTSSPQKRAKPACPVSYLCRMPVCKLEKCGWGSAGWRGKGFRAGSRAREQLLSVPRHPWRLSRWKSEWELTHMELVLFQLPKRKTTFFQAI